MNERMVTRKFKYKHDVRRVVIHREFGFVDLGKLLDDGFEIINSTSMINSDEEVVSVFFVCKKTEFYEDECSKECAFEGCDEVVTYGVEYCDIHSCKIVVQTEDVDE